MVSCTSFIKINNKNLLIDSDLDGRGLSALSGRVPNTNKHSMEGSNPIWMQAYENEWFKAPDDFSQNSEHDSLDENVVSGDLPRCNNLQHCNNMRTQNLYQTLPPALPRRKLETTELWRLLIFTDASAWNSKSRKSADDEIGYL